MPSTSKKQHNFMAAIANSSAFAKKVGISQSVGKDFTAADKGRKFRTGGMPAAINKQDTQHGSMDMPFKSVRKFAGMKAGGKVKRYGGEDESQVSNDNDPTYPDKTNNNIYVPKAAEGMDESDARQAAIANLKEPNRKYSPKTVGEPVSYGNEGRRVGASQTGAVAGRTMAPKLRQSSGEEDKPDTYRSASDKTGAVAGRTMVPKPRQSSGEEDKPDTYRSASDKTGAVTGRTMYAKSRPSDEQKEKNTKNFRDMTMTAASMVPVGRAVSLGASALKAASAARAARTAGAMEKAAEGTARQVRLNTPEPRNSILDEVRKRVIEEGKSGLKKGGNVKYNFEKSGKDVEKKGMKEGSKADMALDKKQMMKKGGMPMKGGKPAFMMKKGGMAGYAKGGGIESKGKTKGTVIRMASGGSVSSASRRADGIAQRGKTRC